jgi:hypothetical protein
MRAMTTTALDPLAATPSATAAVVDRFLVAAEAGRGGDLVALYAADAVLDATVPHWRFQLTGPERIAAQYSAWFSEPGVFEELVRMPTPTGEAVRYAIRSTADGTPYVAHHSHLFEVDEAGAIVRDTFFCGGRWGESLLARMAEEQQRAG